MEFDPAMNNSYETIDENGPPKSLAKLFENTSIAETSGNYFDQQITN